MTISVNSSPLYFSYNVGSIETNVQTIISQFSVNSTYCTLDDLVLSISINPPNIVAPTLNTATKVLNWFTQSVTSSENFTITVLGTITTSNVTPNTMAVLNIYVNMDPTCFNSTSIIPIILSSVGNQTYYLYSELGYVTIEFATNSSTCPSSTIE